LIIRKPIPTLLEQIKRGRFAIFETVDGLNIEEISLTGPPRVDRETGDLLIGFRRPDGTLDVVAVCSDVKTERSITDYELVALVEGLRQAINDCSTDTGLERVARRYITFCRNNRLTEATRNILLEHFPLEILESARVN